MSLTIFVNKKDVLQGLNATRGERGTPPYNFFQCNFYKGKNVKTSH